MIILEPGQQAPSPEGGDGCRVNRERIHFEGNKLPNYTEVTT
jgi:hypothetical protein